MNIEKINLQWSSIELWSIQEEIIAMLVVKKTDEEIFDILRAWNWWYTTVPDDRSTYSWDDMDYELSEEDSIQKKLPADFIQEILDTSTDSIPWSYKSMRFAIEKRKIYLYQMNAFLDNLGVCFSKMSSSMCDLKMKLDDSFFSSDFYNIALDNNRYIDFWLSNSPGITKIEKGLKNLSLLEMRSSTSKLDAYIYDNQDILEDLIRIIKEVEKDSTEEGVDIQFFKTLTKEDHEFLDALIQIR